MAVWQWGAANAHGKRVGHRSAMPVPRGAFVDRIRIAEVCARIIDEFRMRGNELLRVHPLAAVHSQHVLRNQSVKSM